METHISLSSRQFKSLLTKCSGKRVALDTETTGLFWWRDHLTTVSFHCPDAGVEGSIDFAESWTEELQAEVRQIVNDTLAAGTTVILHNAKFDLSFLGVPDDIVMHGWTIVDTTVLIHLYDSRLPKSLEKAEKLLLGGNSKRQAIDDDSYPQPEIMDPATGKKVRKTAKPKVWTWHKDKRQLYCVNDARVTYQMAVSMFPIIKDLGLLQLYNKDMQYMRDIYQIEHRGILIDPEFIGRSKMQLVKDLKIMEQHLYDAAGHEFNYRSNVQLSRVLYEEMGHPRPINPFADKDGVDRSRFADKGKYNKTLTSSFILVEKAHHPLGGLINSMRETAKLIKTLEQWLTLMDENSMLHTNFNITGTRTGRLSSSKPNLQNTPSMIRNVFTSHETERAEEYNLRNAFIVPPGYKLLSVDYKQMEIFYFAIVSQEPAMLEFIKTGQDIHSQIAMRVWGVADQTHRKWSKQISLGLLYGMTLGTLMFKLGMTRDESQRVVDDYWNQFPRIRPWLFEVIAECKEKGYLTYWSGRLWRENVEEHMYKGANALIQGGMADMLSIAELRVGKWLREHPVGRVVNIVHDEFLFYIEEDKIEKVAVEICKLMQVPDLFGIPFNTDIKIGTTYGNLEKLDEHHAIELKLF